MLLFAAFRSLESSPASVPKLITRVRRVTPSEGGRSDDPSKAEPGPRALPPESGVIPSSVTVRPGRARLGMSGDEGYVHVKHGK
eukprot:447030-Hanusia_phi.AAC.12